MHRNTVNSVEITELYSHSVEKLEIRSHQKNISSNQLFSNLLFRKTVTFTKFLPKMREREFP